MCHPAQLSLEQLLKDCRLQRSRGSGPGGQHRNKVETAIVVEHLPSGLRGEASERRSQDQNRRQAIHRLRVKLALYERRSPAAGPSSVWRQRLKAGRISANSEHEEFPALLAEALDVVCANAFEVSVAAKQLEVTTSQLIKFLKIERGALELVNRERVEAGQPKLR
ncbi:MAG: peptide chain release factor-like protein [Planctomycetes bacterium]|nr:peptide chain release factor-like protein [Planctomycetota bacterium]